MDDDIDTWSTRDLPVLRAVCILADENGGIASFAQIAEATGMDLQSIGRAVNALRLEEPPFFSASIGMGMMNGTVQRVSGHARRTVGQWPSPESLADQLVKALTVAADRSQDEEERTWLRRTATWFGSAGRDLLVDVTGAVVARQVGG